MNSFISNQLLLVVAGIMACFVAVGAVVWNGRLETRGKVNGRHL